MDSSAALERVRLSLQMKLTVVPGGQLVHAPPLTEEFRLVVDAQVRLRARARARARNPNPQFQPQP